MEKARIRKATLADIPAIVRIHKACVRTVNARVYPKSVIRAWLRQISVEKVKSQFRSSKWAVLRHRNKVIGFCQYSVPDKTLYQIQIAPRHIRKGYGRKLYFRIESGFRKRKVKTIALNATLNAVPFYKALGFKRIKTISFPLDSTGVKMVYMKKRLR